MYINSDVIRRVKEFEQRHGEKYSDGYEIYFADGAMRDADPIGVLMPPPDAGSAEGEYKLANNKLTFAKLKLKAAVDEFDDLNTRLANIMPNEPDVEIARLKQLAKLVEERKTLVTQATAALEKTEWGGNRVSILRRQQEERQRIDEFQRTRQSIRI